MRVQHQSTADGATPLHRAAQTGNIKIASLLINHGAYVNPTNYLGETPLDLAIQFKNPEIAKFFESKGGQKKRTHQQEQKSKQSQKKRRNRRRNAYNNKPISNGSKMPIQTQSNNKDSKQNVVDTEELEQLDEQDLQDHLVVESECSHYGCQHKAKDPELVCKKFDDIQTGKFNISILNIKYR